MVVIMGDRSRLLYDIELALKARGIDCRLGSVPDLRSVLPGLKRQPCTIDRLTELLEKIRSGYDLEPLLNKGTTRKCKSTREQIIIRFIRGESANSIAKSEGVSSKRICKIIGNAALIRRRLREGVSPDALIKKFAK